MKWRIYILVFAFCFGVAPSSFGMHFRLSNSKLSGLIAHPIIAAIHRDRSGFLWIGTQEGLYKFDGANFTLFNSYQTNKNWIPASDIRGISEDSEGNIIVATYGGGLLTWDFASEKFLKNERPDLLRDYITHLYVSKRGNVWLATKERVILYASESGIPQGWLSSQQATSAIGRPYALLEDNFGNLLVGSDLGLLRILPEDKIISGVDLSQLNIKERFGVTALEFDENDNLIIGTDSGRLAIFDSRNSTLLAQTQVEGDSPVLITDIELYEDMLIAATDRGLYVADRNLSYIEDISNQGSGLSNNDVFSLHLDENLLWVGTYNGLDLLSLAPFELFNDKNSRVNNDILAFTQDSQARMWVGTYDGLFIYDINTNQHQRFESYFEKYPLKDQRVTALTATDSHVWAGYFQGGLQSINILTGRIETPFIEISDKIFVTDIVASTDGKDIWIATDNYGLIRITPEKTHYYRDSISLKEDGITLLFNRGDNILLVSNSNRIYEYDRARDHFTLLEFNFGFGFGRTIVLSIAEDETGNIWFGTKNHGIFKWPLSNQNSKSLRVEQPKEDFLNSSTIYGIQVDSAGNLWCSTQNGIAKLSPDGKLIKRFTSADGLQGSDFTLGASFKSREGLIYFGGTNGYNRFNPEEVEIDNSPSPMRLTGIGFPSQDNTSLGAVARLKSLLLTHRDHFVTFQFSVLDFIDSERNQFRYKLENYNADWIENGTDNTATFANLPSGEYVFRAQGANSAGIWNREGISLNVTVLPAPWFTWWAYTLYALISACLLWSLHRIYRSYAIDRKSAELALEMFEAENRADDEMQEQLELQDEMVRSAHQHNLTTLKLVSDSIALRSINQDGKNSSELAESSLERITALSSLENCLSYHAGGPVANLHKYTEGILAELLKHSPVPAETLVTINQVTTSPIPAELASPLSIVIYELLKNSVQHAFGAESPANYIHIDLAPENAQNSRGENLVLTVHDSGHSVSNNLDEPLCFSGGLAIVKLITSELRGNLEISQERGTTIVLRIPYSDYP